MNSKLEFPTIFQNVENVLRQFLYIDYEYFCIIITIKENEEVLELIKIIIFHSCYGFSHILIDSER